MNKNDVFTFTAPNGVEVAGVVVLECPCYEDMEGHWEQYIIYAQNRIAFWNFNTEFPDRSHLGGILVDYAILPDYDKLMQLHSSMEYPQWEQNLEAEIQGSHP